MNSLSYRELKQKIEKAITFKNNKQSPTRLTKYIHSLSNDQLASCIEELPKAILEYQTLINKVPKVALEYYKHNYYLCIFIRKYESESKTFEDMDILKNCFITHMGISKTSFPLLLLKPLSRKSQQEALLYPALTMQIYCDHSIGLFYKSVDNPNYIYWVNFNRLKLLEHIQALMQDELKSR